MIVTVLMYKHPKFEVNVNKAGTIRDLKISISNYLRIPITENNLRNIYILKRGEKCLSNYSLSSLHISDQSVIRCHINAKSLEKISPPKFDDELQEYNSQNLNVNDQINGIDKLYFEKPLKSLNNDNDFDFQSNDHIPNRLYQTSKYIYDDDTNIDDDLPYSFSDFNYYYAMRSKSFSCESPPKDSTLPIFKDIALTKVDSHPKGLINLINNYNNAQNYIDRQNEKYYSSKVSSSVNFNCGSNLHSQSFTSGQNLPLNQDEPSCECLPCCFPNTYSFNNLYDSNDDNYETNSYNQLNNDDNKCITINTNNSDNNNNTNNTNNLTSTHDIHSNSYDSNNNTSN
ncbi:hypothetical protein M9Y10_035413 [Tritrichomonas musculus]|uniref:Ubiquitin-like domain-containing protein n=1 Tax=Tritrichomonas musculus TaxID=1915356 RepID=A0ABR2KHP3_9EUKA